MSETVCVIGAGASGLAIARHLKKSGLEFKVFDKSDGVGGLWRYGSKGSNVYASAHLISSKAMTEYPDFPMPEDYPDFPHHSACLAYMESYADAFDLRGHMHFNTEIKKADRVGDKWQVDFEGGGSEQFDHLIIANGHLSEPVTPTFDGQDSFPGELFHSTDFREATVMAGKRVLVVGARNSACDIAVDGVFHADDVLWSVRGGHFFVPKFIGGKPSDQIDSGLTKMLPRKIGRRMSQGLVQFVVGKPSDYGLPEPDYGFLERSPVMNSTILHHVKHGDVSVRPEIARIDGSKVIFKDGQEDEVDMIILGTGYQVSIPFIDPKHLNWQDAAPELDLNIFAPDYNNLYVVGLLEASGGGWRVRDAQAQLICAYILAQGKSPKKAAAFRKAKKGQKDDRIADPTGQNQIFVNYDTYRPALEKFTETLSG